jgi:hypothetical protein
MAMTLAWYSRNGSDWQEKRRSLAERDEPGVQPGPPGILLDLGVFLIGRFVFPIFGAILVGVRVRFVLELLVVGRLGFLILTTWLLTLGTRLHLAIRLFRIRLTNLV